MKNYILLCGAMLVGVSCLAQDANMDNYFCAQKTKEVTVDYVSSMNTIGEIKLHPQRTKLTLKPNEVKSIYFQEQVLGGLKQVQVKIQEYEKYSQIFFDVNVKVKKIKDFEETMTVNNVTLTMLSNFSLVALPKLNEKVDMNLIVTTGYLPYIIKTNKNESKIDEKTVEEDKIVFNIDKCY